jgi:hypothetical protein
MTTICERILFHFVYFRPLSSCLGNKHFLHGNDTPLFINLRVSLKVLCLPPYEHICGCFLIHKFTIFVFKCWILFYPMLGDVNNSLHFPVLSIYKLSNIFNCAFLYFLYRFLFSLFLVLIMPVKFRWNCTSCFWEVVRQVLWRTDRRTDEQTDRQQKKIPLSSRYTVEANTIMN